MSSWCFIQKSLEHDANSKYDQLPLGSNSKCHQTARLAPPRLVNHSLIECGAKEVHAMREHVLKKACSDAHILTDGDREWSLSLKIIQCS